MPTRALPRITAWSWSTLTEWEECPARLKYKKLDKLPEPKSDALERGSMIHALAERYVRGDVARLPEELKTFAKEFRALRKAPARRAEEEWAFDEKWKSVPWLDPTVRCRMKVDLAHDAPGDPTTLVVIDYKTGKVREEKGRQQVELYALGGLAARPDVATVRASLWFTDAGVMLPDPPLEVGREMLAALKKRWEKRALPLLMDRAFPPRPGDYCRYCAFRKSAGGPCAF